MELMSPAFKNKENIPLKFTCDGEDVSPALAWKGSALRIICKYILMSLPRSRGRTPLRDQIASP